MNYWWVKENTEAIDAKPSWIWRTIDRENQRVPKFFWKIKAGDRYVLYAYVSRRKNESVHLLRGTYKVTRPFDGEKRKVKLSKVDADAEGYDELSQRAYVIEGEPLDVVDRNVWIPIPSPGHLVKIRDYYQQLVNPISKSDFENVTKWIKNSPRDLEIIDSEPQNEQGVVALFTHFMDRLGFRRYISIQTRFPDALLLRRNGSTVEAEFEFYASNYDHALSKKRICICWIDDLRDEKLNNFPQVLELRSTLS